LKSKKKKNIHDIVIDYSKQPSFEFGVICYELLCPFCHPLEDYPLGHGEPIKISFNKKIKRAPKVEYKKLIGIISRLLKNDPNYRPDIEKVLPKFDQLIEKLGAQ